MAWPARTTKMISHDTLTPPLTGQESGMTNRRIIANTISTVAALGAACASMYVSVRYLAPPKGLTDWTIQITGATTAGIFAFFLVWGHFQEIPRPPLDDATLDNAVTSAPSPSPEKA